MSNLSVRVISALILSGVSLTLFVISLSTRWIWVSALILIGAWEFSRLIYTKYSPELNSKVCFLASGITFLFLWLNNPWYNLHAYIHQSEYLWAITLFGCLVYILVGFKFIKIENLAPWIFLHITGFLFMGLWVAQIYQLFLPQTGIASLSHLLLVVLCMTSADSGAYFSGKLFGKTKLSPVISPKKTIEGVLGGALLTCGLMIPLGHYLANFNLIQSMSFALIMVLTAVLGDLIMSSFKRFSNLKDTSQVIPGHGGILDRFDSLFFSIPFATLLFKVF